MGSKGFLVVLAFLAFHCQLYSVQSLCILPCDRGQFCNDGDVTPIPGACDEYYVCQFNQWLEQDCAPGSLFNMSNVGLPGEMCECVLAELNSTCPYDCPTDTPPTVPPQAPCPDVPDPCEDGIKYADQSNCSFYYLCEEGSLQANPTLCEVGPEHGFCNVTGLPCVFDISSSQCLHPDRDFDCELRCTATSQKKAPKQENQVKKAKELFKEAINRLKDAENEVVKAEGELKQAEARLVQEFVVEEESVDAPAVKMSTEIPGPVCLDRDLVCNRPPYCTEGEALPEPSGGCTQYYECVYGYWALYTCALGSEFSISECECVLEGSEECDYGCAVTTAPPLQIPGPCGGDACIDGNRVPDRANCEDYWICVDGAWQRRNCIGGTSDDCNLVGYACAYDRGSERCIHPDTSFVCEQGCALEVDDQNEVEKKPHVKP